MKFIQENWVGLVAMLIAIIGCYLPVSNAVQQFGGANCNGGNCVDYDAVNTTAGYYVNDSAIVNSSGVFVGVINSSTFTEGGGVFATTSIGAGTLTAANIASAHLIEQTNTGVVTITLPASSTLSAMVPTAGSSRSIFFANLGSATVTIAGGSGTLLRVASSSVATPGVVPGSIGRLEFVRKSNTDILVHFVPAI